MRVAVIPLDSRPANYQFPKRLAAIAGIELALPPRKLLGTLHTGADGLALANWLKDECESRAGQPGCQAVVLSWDALLYGGLVQSRRLDTAPTPLAELRTVLAEIDWQNISCYSFLTVPRLGITVDSAASEPLHETVRQYFIASAEAEYHTESARERDALQIKLTTPVVERLWEWRARNAKVSQEAMDLSAELGFKLCHVAVEDNAPQGPHLDEVKALKRHWFEIRRTLPKFKATFFDGADECVSLLMARAVTETANLPTLPVQLRVHPATPGADTYYGLFESQHLAAGLELVASWLKLDFRYEADIEWLVTFGVQPQPDLFSGEPEKIFHNPYLLPKHLGGQGALFVSDLAACNGANPYLVPYLSGLSRGRLSGLVGFNTNFNTLGVSAAWLRLLHMPGSNYTAARRFLLERIADDVVYQSIARPQVLAYLREQELDPMDFHTSNEVQQAELTRIVRDVWQRWQAKTENSVTRLVGISRTQAESVEFSFPWQRAFEIEATAAE